MGCMLVGGDATIHNAGEEKKKVVVVDMMGRADGTDGCRYGINTAIPFY